MTEKRKLIDVRYELSTYRGLIDPVLFNEVLQKRIQIEDLIGESDLLIKASRRTERALEVSAVSHSNALEPDIKGSSNKLKRSFLKAAMRAWIEDKNAAKKGYVDHVDINRINYTLTGNP